MNSPNSLTSPWIVVKSCQCQLILGWKWFWTTEYKHWLFFYLPRGKNRSRFFSLTWRASVRRVVKKKHEIFYTVLPSQRMNVFADFEQYSGNFRQELLLFSWDFPFSETGLISKCKSWVQLFNVPHIGINLTRLRSGDQVSVFPVSLLDEFCPIPEKRTPDRRLE